MNRIAAAVFGLSFVTSGFASSPGQPLDCSDWVAAQPGYTCMKIWPPTPRPDNAPDFERAGSESVIDNESHMLLAASNDSNAQVQLFRMKGDTYEEIGRFVDRVGLDYMRGEPARLSCDGQGHCLQTSPWKILFDDKSGTVLIPVRSLGVPYGEVRWIAAISGFTRAYDLLQTYAPSPASIDFRVPPIPEGLGGADHFDTYYGPLANPIDLAQAQPLQCNYPATPPAPGDYLTVADPLPNPSAGTGRYYLTTVTYQGETRAGRRAVNGVLRGRDPAGIPVCSPPPLRSNPIGPEYDAHRFLTVGDALYARSAAHIYRCPPNSEVGSSRVVKDGPR